MHMEITYQLEAQLKRYDRYLQVGCTWRKLYLPKQPNPEAFITIAVRPGYPDIKEIS